MMIRKRFRFLTPGLLTAAVTAAILWLTLAPQPLPEADLPLFPGADKVVHALMFGGLVFALVFDRELWRLRRQRLSGKLPQRKLYIIVLFFLAASVFGGVIELIQEGMQAGRTGDAADFAADCAGAFLSALVSPAIASWLLGTSARG